MTYLSHGNLLLVMSVTAWESASSEARVQSNILVVKTDSNPNDENAPRPINYYPEKINNPDGVQIARNSHGISHMSNGWIVYVVVSSRTVQLKSVIWRRLHAICRT